MTRIRSRDGLDGCDRSHYNYVKYSQHVLDKLERYALSWENVVDAHHVYEFYDKKEDSKIRIIAVDSIFFALVIDPKTGKAITIYRTDEKTIQNRRRVKRWI